MNFKKKLLANFLKRLKNKKHLTRKKAFVYLAVGILLINLLAAIASFFSKIFTRRTFATAISIVIVAGVFSYVYNFSDDINNKSLRRLRNGAKRVALNMNEEFFGENSLADFSLNEPSEVEISFNNFDAEDLETQASNFIAGKNPYFIRVNRQMNVVTVYTYDETGAYNIPIKAMTCSVGLDGETPLGTFTTSDRHEWGYMVDGTWAKYCVRIDGPILFHSVPYYTKDESDLEWEQFNKLGEDASLGCVRMAINDVKWIFDNIPFGTTVEIYDAPEVGPLGKPDTIDINGSCTWDPSNIYNENNPWNSKAPTLEGVESKVVKADEPVDLLEGVKAYDSCGNDVSSKIKIETDLDLTKSGEYTVKYTITDVLGRSASQTATIIVFKNVDTYTYNLQR